MELTCMGCKLNRVNMYLTCAQLKKSPIDSNLSSPRAGTSMGMRSSCKMAFNVRSTGKLQINERRNK